MKKKIDKGIIRHKNAPNLENDQIYQILDIDSNPMYKKSEYGTQYMTFWP